MKPRYSLKAFLILTTLVAVGAWFVALRQRPAAMVKLLTTTFANDPTRALELVGAEELRDYLATNPEAAMSRDDEVRKFLASEAIEGPTILSIASKEQGWNDWFFGRAYITLSVGVYWGGPVGEAPTIGNNWDCEFAVTQRRFELLSARANADGPVVGVSLP